MGEAAPEATLRPSIDLAPLFAPRSVAVVGASPRGGIARTVRDNLVATGSETRCHFVNPRYPELFGQPCHPSLEALPERPDVAIVALSPLRAAAAVEAAARAGVPAVVVPGGGVVEGGEAAAAMQRDVARIAREHRTALVGPNCMGVWDLTTNASAYIGDVNPWLPRGGVAGIAQSGSVTDAFIHSGNRIGFSRIIGCGAEAVLDVCDYLAWCLDDPETQAVILFVEGFKRPERFLALADRALQLGKPLAAVKVGRSEHARAAAVAHTGSLAGEERVTDAALDAVGVIRCADLDELLETAELLDGCRRTGRSVRGGRTGVVTVSTGEAALVADLAPRTGVDLPPIPAPALDRIRAELPTMAYLANPLDPWGAADAERAYAVAFDALAGSGAYDLLVVVHDFPYRSLPSEVEVATTVTRALLAAVADRPEILPVYVSLTSGEPPPEIVELLAAEGAGAPILRGAVEAFAAIARVARWEAIRDRRRGTGPRRAGWTALAANRTALGEDRATVAPADPALPSTGAAVPLPELESLARLAAAGVSTVEARTAAEADDAVSAARAIGWPVALKVDAVGLPHKTDVGAVRLGLVGDDAVREAAHELLALGLPPGAARRGLLVQPMAPPGVELLVGARRDPLWGPVVVVGLGGILAEVLDDVVVRLAPVGEAEAREMLGELRGATLLRHHRRRAGVDEGAVARAVVAIAALIADDPAVVEVEINPLVASPAGAVAVDALVVAAAPAYRSF